MANSKFPYTPELRAFQVADDAWSALLQETFGKRAGNARYSDLGKGVEGSELRRLHDERMAAQAMWHRAAY